MNPTCPSGDRYAAQLSAYHDGEVMSDRRAEIQRHLAQCPACAEALREIESMSKGLAALSVPEISQIALARVHQNLDAVMQKQRRETRLLLRISEAVGALAACVMIAGSLWIMHAPHNGVASAPPPWNEISPSPDLDPAVNDADSPVSQWYLTNTASRSDEAP